MPISIMCQAYVFINPRIFLKSKQSPPQAAGLSREMLFVVFGVGGHGQAYRPTGIRPTKPKPSRIGLRGETPKSISKCSRMSHRLDAGTGERLLRGSHIPRHPLTRMPFIPTASSGASCHAFVKLPFAAKLLQYTVVIFFFGSRMGQHYQAVTIKGEHSEYSTDFNGSVHLDLEYDWWKHSTGRGY